MVHQRWKERCWIVDGHNAIFGLPALCSLQTRGERQQARRDFETLLEPFARSLRRPLLVVYDGNQLLPNPDARDCAWLQTLYSQPPEEADDRIVFLAQQMERRGQAVTIVTNDRRSLCPRLPRGVNVISVQDFRDRFLYPGSRPVGAEKRISEEDRRELEEVFLKRDQEIQTSARRGARRREREAAQRWRARLGAPRPLREDGQWSTLEEESHRVASREGDGGADMRWRPDARERVREQPRAPEPDPRAVREDAAAGGEAAREARKVKRERGLRRQKRRLERLRRGKRRAGPRQGRKG